MAGLHAKRDSWGNQFALSSTGWMVCCSSVMARGPPDESMLLQEVLDGIGVLLASGSALIKSVVPSATLVNSADGSIFILFRSGIWRF